jgi:hypothetical protein
MMQSNLPYSYKLLQLASWILFIGLAIDAGGYLSNTLYTLLVNPACAAGFWGYLDISPLYNDNFTFFCCFAFLLVVISLLKTVLFYHTVKVFHEKKVNLSKPFNETLTTYLFRFAFIALSIGLCCYAGKSFSAWLTNQGVAMPPLEAVKMGGSDVWLFMGITLLVVAQLFKKGIEIQTENDLTV